ncbi:hypothetical protein DSO57_1032774 [Entomophthora muscae]|uniref:Uncharacterized protein n=1 Tax=Entomophthora muscae TaxID=34485 RepID=A0ACC2U9A3_9FUNG|nr:hypothetical protein DSO57_1032774 [Entomophthora muscae]
MKLSFFGSAVAVLISATLADNSMTTEQILAQANELLSSGKFSEAFNSYSEAIKMDPENYITYFKRATASMTLGRNQVAIEDLTRLLSLKPDFTKGLLQRGKLHLKLGNFNEALGDVTKFSESSPGNAQASELLKAIQESKERFLQAEKLLENKKHEEASEHLSEVLRNAPHFIEARRKRAFSAISRNEYDGAIGDWTRIVALSPSDQDSLANLAHVYYYSLYEPESALKNVKQYLHSDPEHKRFKTLFRQLKNSEKQLAKLDVHVQKKYWKDAVDLLEGTEETSGLLKQVEDKVLEMMTSVGSTHPGPNKLSGKLHNAACLAYSRLRDAKTIDFCNKALEIDPENIKSLVARSEMFIKQELYERAIEDLTKAYEASDKDQKIGEKLQKARLLLKQSKQRDYYKVLGVPRSASQRQIKAGFRKLAAQWHPDKYRGDLPKEKIQEKMAEINQAYEVLSNEELKQRFDNGDDPNDPTGGQEHHGNPFQGGGGQFFKFHQGGFPGGQFSFSF